MSARAELEARARAGFRAVMLSNHTAEKFASESSARELRFLCSVFDEECSWREKSKRERLLKRARFPVPKTFDGYDWSAVSWPEGFGCADLLSLSFLEGAHDLVLMGDVGTGKTFAGGCIVNALEDLGHPCLMTSFSRLEKVLFDMKEGKRSFLDKLLLFDLVLFDDLGVERDTEYMTEQVTGILNSFYRAGIPMIVTSNYTPKQLTGAEDIRKKRVYDRLLERCHPILVDGESRRKQQGRHDYASMKNLLGL
jgi:DNA replication protein DnaC